MSLLLLGLGALGLLGLLTADNKKTPPALGAAPAGPGAGGGLSPSDLLGVENVGGVLKWRPDVAAALIAGALTKYAAVAMAGGNGERRQLLPLAPGLEMASVWAFTNAAYGRSILINADGRQPGELWSVTPEQAATLANAQAGAWAVLLESKGAAQAAFPGGLPALPAAPAAPAAFGQSAAADLPPGWQSYSLAVEPASGAQKVADHHGPALAGWLAQRSATAEQFDAAGRAGVGVVPASPGAPNALAWALTSAAKGLYVLAPRSAPTALRQATRDDAAAAAAPGGAWVVLAAPPGAQGAPVPAGQPYPQPYPQGYPQQPQGQPYPLPQQPPAGPGPGAPPFFPAQQPGQPFDPLGALGGLLGALGGQQPPQAPGYPQQPQGAPVPAGQPYPQGYPQQPQGQPYPLPQQPPAGPGPGAPPFFPGAQNVPGTLGGILGGLGIPGFPQQPQGPQGPSPTPAIDALPPQIRTQVLSAVASGDPARLDQLAAGLGPQYPAAAAELKRLAVDLRLARRQTAILEGRLLEVRQNDNPSHWAAWYTGNGGRWAELLRFNGIGTVKVNGITQPDPRRWYPPINGKPGAEIELPPDWPAAKGLPPPLRSAPRAPAAAPPKPAAPAAAAPKARVVSPYPAPGPSGESAAIRGARR